MSLVNELNLEDICLCLVGFHTKSCEILDRGYSTAYKSSPALTMEMIDDVIEDVADSIEEYNVQHNICPVWHDTAKVTCFVAPELYKKNNQFRTAPLFFGYFNALDESHLNSGKTVRSIGPLPELCENLHNFITVDQWLSPFAFVKGVELTFEGCAIEKVSHL